MTPETRSPIEELLARYRSAFETFDGPAIAGLFAYPCQITGDGDPASVTIAASRDEWLPQVERLLDAYRAIGVASAEVRDLAIHELSPRLALAFVGWRLVHAGGHVIYDVDAAYTLADFGTGRRIVAAAHNESSRLRPLRSRPG